jgi:hypothetical protein
LFNSITLSPSEYELARVRVRVGGDVR